MDELSESISEPMTIAHMEAIALGKPAGTYAEYYCGICGRRVTSKYFSMVHMDDESPECVVPPKYRFRFVIPGA